MTTPSSTARRIAAAQTAAAALASSQDTLSHLYMYIAVTEVISTLATRWTRRQIALALQVRKGGNEKETV